MTILLYVWQAYNYTDIEETFRKMGHETDRFVYHLLNYEKNDVFAEQFAEKLSKKAYDFVFTVNYFPIVAEVCHDRKLPYVTWTCDSPLISMHHESVFYPENFIFDFDLASMRLFEEMGVEHIWHLPLAANVDRMDALLLHAKDLCAYTNEISFVGNLYERNSYDRLETKLPDYLRGYFAAAMEIQANVYGSNVLEEALTPNILEELAAYFTLDKSEASFSDIGLIFSTTILGYKVARMQRLEALSLLSKKHPVGVYTESNTAALPNVITPESFGEHAIHRGILDRGGLDYWEELPKVFYKSRVNLNLTIPNIRSGLPLRMWDVLGAGGFLLTNYQAETAMYLKEGEDLVSFYDRDDMKEKAAYYLVHEKERAKIAAHGRETVRRRHTLRHRIEEMLTTLQPYLQTN